MSTIDVNPIHPIAKVKKQSTHNNRIGVDIKFIEQLMRLDGQTLRIGKRLLSRIRRITPGRFTYSPVSGRFVESPDPYWAIQIEKKSRRFCILVFGRPDEHSPTHNLKMDKYMESYSIFHIDNISQLDEVCEKIYDAKRIMKNKRTLNYHHQ